jgi:hypothetical protein
MTDTPKTLPEYPKKPKWDTKWDEEREAFLLHYETEDGRHVDCEQEQAPIYWWNYEQRRAAFWESRCRLAVEALKPFAGVGIQSPIWLNATEVINAIGPLPDASPCTP